MGLDMYMRRKLYVKNGAWNGENTWKITVEKNGKKYDTKEISELVESVGYWRKANQIHAWFVENVQAGEDDCREAYVPREDLERLLKTVETVLQASKLVPGKVHNGTRYSRSETGEMVREEIFEDGQVIEDSTVAQELLPTQEGFFFGGNGYDEYYYNQLVYTRDLLRELLADTSDEYEYYYESSW